MTLRWWILGFITFFFIGIGGFWTVRTQVISHEVLPIISASPTLRPMATATMTPTVIPTAKASPTPTPVPKKIFGVPFTVQAPLGNWSADVYQDGCEEASSIMAMGWAQGNNLTPTPPEAKALIKKMSDFELKKYGEYRDRSAADTAQLIKDYFSYAGVSVKPAGTIQAIKDELVAGNILIVPMNGQALHNPYFTPPGPMEHMVVVKGYDAATKEFITNDPGTRHGENYRYDEKVLFAAIRDYPTGNHLPIVGIKKVMIVVEPNG